MVFYPAICFGQQQERSLIDRLLRPDMDLQNRAQSKTFAANSKVIERRGTVGTFVLQPSVSEKRFADTRTATTTDYHYRPLQSGLRTISSSRNHDASATASINSSQANDVREIPDSHRQVASRNFADHRSFRDEGKSQKSLDRQNPPLTIDQVRELLNKNK